MQVAETVPITALDFTTPAVTKIKFESLTPGAHLYLCIGTYSDVLANLCPKVLDSSGGPGFPAVLITDLSQYSGKVLYVQNLDFATVPHVEYLFEVE